MSNVKRKAQPNGNLLFTGRHFYSPEYTPKIVVRDICHKNLALFVPCHFLTKLNNNNLNCNFSNFIKLACYLIICKQLQNRYNTVTP